MIIKYLGPRSRIRVAPYGWHEMEEEKEYPDEFGEELMETSKKNHFERVGKPPEKKEAPKTKIKRAEKGVSHEKI